MVLVTVWWYLLLSGGTGHGLSCATCHCRVVLATVVWYLSRSGGTCHCPAVLAIVRWHFPLSDGTCHCSRYTSVCSHNRLHCFVIFPLHRCHCSGLTLSSRLTLSSFVICYPRTTRGYCFRFVSLSVFLRRFVCVNTTACKVFSTKKRASYFNCESPKLAVVLGFPCA